METGSREDCSVFYEAPRAFYDETKAKAFETAEEVRLNKEAKKFQSPWTHCYSVEVE